MEPHGEGGVSWVSHHVTSTHLDDTGDFGAQINLTLELEDILPPWTLDQMSWFCLIRIHGGMNPLITCNIIYILYIIIYICVHHMF